MTMRPAKQIPLSSAPVMYHGTVRRLPFREQVKAAVLAGCRAITIDAWSYRGLLAKGLSPRDLMNIAADAGVRITHLDPFVTWVPNWQPAEIVPDFPVEVLDCSEDALYAMAQALGLQSLTVAATYAAGSLPSAEVIDRFGGLCHRADRHGLRCDLEFVPFSAIADLAAALAIVEGAAAPNSGIMFDFWHFVRSGSSLDLLATIPGNRISGVQINDGSARLPAGVTMIEDSMMGRLPVGDGEFPVATIVNTLTKIGGLNNVGPEIFATAFDSMPAEEIAVVCRASIDRVSAMAR